jgi:hypothetical protein
MKDVKMTQSADQLYKERLARVQDAVQLKVPDRVPLIAAFRYFAARYGGVPYSSVYYDAESWLKANEKTIVDYQPDMYYAPDIGFGRANEILGLKTIKWPGRDWSGNISHQFVEKEYVQANEYEALLDDLSGFALKNYLPRVYEALEPLASLPAAKSLFLGHGRLLTALANPEVQRALEAMIQAGREVAKIRPQIEPFAGKMEALGFPSINLTMLCTFDAISDYLRGMKGSMLDMFRQPDRLMQALEKLEPLVLEQAVQVARSHRNTLVHIPLHRGADGFMSDEQFRTFYWPGLKRLIMTLINEGVTPCPFFEGGFNSRLEYLREFPKGKVLARFDTTDMFRAKEVIGDTVCICGNISISLLKMGTPDDIRGYCKKLIDMVGKDGGFVMCTGNAMDDADPANVRVWMDFTREYGVYR